LRYCQRAQEANLSHTISGLPTPQARSFELPGDRLQFAPDRSADIQHVKLNVALDFEQETISGNVSTTFSALYEEVRSLTFDAIELHIESVTLENGTSLAYTTTDKKLTVTLDRPYQYGEVFTIVINYHARPRTGLHFMKPVPEEPDRPVHAWTFNQPTYCRYWFPCHDTPNERSTVEVIVTVPAQFQTISNGKLLSVTDHGATRTHHWLQEVPHAAYLVSIVAGDFAVVEDEYQGKPVNYYVHKDRRDDAPLYMGKTPAMIKFFAEFTGVDYPFAKYAQTVVDIYTGAMEHASCTTHSFALLPDKKAALDVGDDLVSVVAHELAHQWFGDLLTCRDWSNGWLNEGFATYFENLWGEHDRGNDEFKYSMLQEKLGYLDEDRVYRRPIVYYVYNDQGFELFDRHLYNKGSWVLHMLRHLLGDAPFKRGLKTYIERFRAREVVTSDLLRTLEEVSGRSLERFFQQWVHSGGHPELDVAYSWDNERKLAKVRIKQTQQTNELTPCFSMPLDLAFTIPASDEPTSETRTVTMQVQLGEDERMEQTYYLPLEREPLLVRVDPNGWLLKTLSFERSTKMLRYQVANDPDVLGRVEAAEVLGGRNEEVSRAALITALNTDSFWAVRATAASALAKHGNAQAQDALIQALQTLDTRQFSRVRAEIASALGTFQAPQQQELAERSAQVLSVLLEQGDVSYQVEASAAEALGQTHLEGQIETLVKALERPSWTNYVQRGIFSGLGATGVDRVVDVMADYLRNPENHPTLRRAAALGLFSVGHNRHLYSEDARQRAITALSNAVEHDSWAPTRMACARALSLYGEKRALAPLERAVNVELDDGAVRVMRLAAQTLRTEDKGEERFKQLRKELDEMREENRKLHDRLNKVETGLK
jgi:aminopeptidase N